MLRVDLNPALMVSALPHAAQWPPGHLGMAELGCIWPVSFRLLWEDPTVLWHGLLLTSQCRSPWYLLLQEALPACPCPHSP
jgi:hypothetical protein